jgi:hypothetical protein
MKICLIIGVSGQVVAFAFLGLYEVFSPEGVLEDVLRVLAVGAYLIAGGAAVVFIVLLVLRVIRIVARVGVFRLIGSLVPLGPDRDLVDEVIDEVLGFGEADERVDSSAERVAEERPGIEDERSHESGMSAQRRGLEGYRRL